MSCFSSAEYKHQDKRTQSHSDTPMMLGRDEVLTGNDSAAGKAFRKCSQLVAATNIFRGEVADIICNQLRQIFIPAIITSWWDYCNPFFAGHRATALPLGICNFCGTEAPKHSSQPRFITHITGKTAQISSAAQNSLERLSAYVKSNGDLMHHTSSAKTFGF